MLTHLKLDNDIDLSSFIKLQNLSKEFYEIYDIDFPYTTPFYIYNRYTKRYIESIYFRNDVVVRCPARFVFDNDPKENDFAMLTFYNTGEYDVRSDAELKTMCLQILFTAKFDKMMIEDTNNSYYKKTYKIFTNITKELLERYTYFEYNENNENDYFVSIKKEIIPNVCKLYNIFPGKKFYIYDARKSRYLNLLDIHQQDKNFISIEPIEFIYENNDIHIVNYDLSLEPEEYEKYILKPFKSIYEDVFVNRIGPIDYKLVKQENHEPKFDRMEEILKKLNIKKDENDEYNFVLTTDKNALFFTYRGFGVDFCKFTYSKKEGLKLIYKELDKEDLDKIKQAILIGKAIPKNIEDYLEYKIYLDHHTILKLVDIYELYGKE